MVDVDVVIVGARVAGCLTAIHVAAAGHRVMLVDAAGFPSDTISTHYFRGAGLVGALREVGLLDAVLALGCPPLTVQYDYAGGSSEPAVNGPQEPGDIGFALSVRRLALDALLVERARATPGVEVRTGTPVRDLVRDDERVTGVVLGGDDAGDVVGARLVVGADGRASHLARLVDAPIDRTEVASRAMYFRYVRGYRGPGGSWDGPEFSLLGDELVYVFPSDDDVACVAISIPLQDFPAFRARPEAAFDARLAAHRGIADRYAATTDRSRMLGTGPKDAVIRQPVGPGWALVGDASLHQDPWTGLGMDNAAVHAGFLGDAITGWLAGDQREGEAFATYHQRRDAHAIDGFDETARYGRDLSVLTA